MYCYWNNSVIHLSSSLFVCYTDYNLGHILKSMCGRVFEFGIHDQDDKTLPATILAIVLWNIELMLRVYRTSGNFREYQISRFCGQK